MLFANFARFFAFLLTFVFLLLSVCYLIALPKQFSLKLDAVQSFSPVEPENKSLQKRIALLHLFGEIPIVSDVAQQALGIHLQGIIFSDDQGASASRAIISEDNAATKTYAVGDLLVGGATLEAIYPDYVLIRQANRLQKLALPIPALNEVSS